MLYSHQPLSYRDGANPGFHEAVGEVMRLSVQTPTHLNKVGLLTDISESRRGEINFLLRTALQVSGSLRMPYGTKISADKSAKNLAILSDLPLYSPPQVVFE